MATRVQQRRGTAEEWESENPILSLGEIGYDTTNSNIRIGDGFNRWNDLDTLSGPPGPEGPAGPTGPTGPAVTGPQGPTGATGPTGAAVHIVSPTFPVDPNNGDAWFNSETGVAAVFYEDGDSGQWVEAGNIGPTGPVGPIGPTGPTGPIGPAGGNAIVGPVQPSSATNGTFWYNSSTLTLFIYFDNTWRPV